MPGQNLEQATSTDTSKVEIAAKTYLDRRDRVSHPDGKFDRGGRWHPSEKEWTPGCDRIREPSRAWPYSLLVHCRSAEHVAELHGVEKGDLLAKARQLDRERKQEQERIAEHAPKPEPALEI